MAKFILMMVIASFLAKLGEGMQSPNYGDALTKSLLFFEGQRSGKLPSDQRLSWRKDSALRDGAQARVDLVGGYYDAGDNVKFNFPMAFSATVLAWGVLEFGPLMGADLGHAVNAVVWAADYLMKATSVENVVFAVVGDPVSDHSCWERPEDMDTLRNAYPVTSSRPGSDLAAEVATALAAASLVLKTSRPGYSVSLAKRAAQVYRFANTYRGIYSQSASQACPFYCSSGYMDELVWGAAWLYKATKAPFYWDFVVKNIGSIGGSFDDFGWDRKNAGINVLVSQIAMTVQKRSRYPFVSDADRFICSILPDSPTRTGSTTFSRGGLLFRSGPSNLQHTTSASFLALTYAQYLYDYDNKRAIRCGSLVVPLSKIINLAKSQVNYILGNNPMQMSYMVGYGYKYPQKVHHRGSTLPSITKYPRHFGCQDGSAYFKSGNPNQNVLVGAVVGGPDSNDRYIDSRYNVSMSEPATYINAPMVGLLAYFKAHPY